MDAISKNGRRWCYEELAKLKAGHTQISGRHLNVLQNVTRFSNIAPQEKNIKIGICLILKKNSTIIYRTATSQKLDFRILASPDSILTMSTHVHITRASELDAGIGQTEGMVRKGAIIGKSDRICSLGK